MHSCHWPKCIGVIDHSLRRYKKAWVSAFVSLTKTHWCHWPSSKEIQKSLRLGICVIDHMHLCHWPLSVIYTQSDAFVSLTKKHWCHWPFPKEIQKSLPLGIRVIDQNAFVSLTTGCDSHSVTCIRVIDQHAFVSLTKGIRVIDHWVWSTLSNLHSCHWPDALVSLTVL